MSDDLLTTVKAALDKSDEWRGSFRDWPKYPPPDGAFELHSVDDIKAWLRALVARVEQFTITAAMFEASETARKQAEADGAEHVRQWAVTNQRLQVAESALAALREQHDNDIRAAFRQGMLAAEAICDDYGELPLGSMDEAWEASKWARREP